MPRYRGGRYHTKSPSITKDFGGDIPEIGGRFAIRSEHVNKKVNYNIFAIN